MDQPRVVGCTFDWLVCDVFVMREFTSRAFPSIRLKVFEMDSLKCGKCGSALFLERAIHLQNEILVVQSVCTNCWRQWYGVDTGRRVVLLEANARAATTVPLRTATPDLPPFITPEPRKLDPVS
jgi:hypothetical protein